MASDSEPAELDTMMHHDDQQGDIPRASRAARQYLVAFFLAPFASDANVECQFWGVGFAGCHIH
jgi:hypothetical protein